MSAKLMGECFELDLAPHATKEASAAAMGWVLIALADHAHTDGTSARPSVRYIAWKVNLSPRTVQRALNRLEEIGLIEAPNGRAGGRRTTDWQIRLDGAPRKRPWTPDAPAAASSVGLERAHRKARGDTVSPLVGAAGVTL